MNKTIKLWQSLLCTVLVAAVILTGVFVYVGKLRSGVEQLYDGAQQLADGSNQIKDGLSQVNDGTGSLNDGLEQYTGGVAQVDDGLGTLSDGLGTYTDGVAQVDDGLGTLQDGLKTYTGGVKQLDGGLGSLQDGLNTYTNGVAQLHNGLGQLAANNDKLNGGMNDLQSGVKTLYSTLGEGMANVTPGLDVNNQEACLTAANTILNNEATVTAGIQAQYVAGVVGQLSPVLQGTGLQQDIADYIATDIANNGSAGAGARLAADATTFSVYVATAGANVPLTINQVIQGTVGGTVTTAAYIDGALAARNVSVPRSDVYEAKA